MVTLSMFIGLPVSIPLGTISLAGASLSGMAMILTKKYQKKLVKVTKLDDIVTLALAVFETSIYKVLNNGRVDEQEFTMFQTFHLVVLSDLSIVDYKMEAETRTQLQKSVLNEVNNLKKAVRKSDASLCEHSSLHVIFCVTTGLTKSLKWMSSKACTIN